MIYRGADRRLYDKQLSPIAFALLGNLQQGTSFGRACELAADQAPDEAGQLESALGDWFAQWGKLGWIGGVSV